MISLECAKDLFFGSRDLAELFVMCVRFKGKTELMRGRKRCVVGEKRSPGRVRIQDEFQPRLPVNMRGMALRVPSNRDVSASARIQEAPARVRTGALAAPGLLFPLGGKPSRSLTRASDLTLAAPQTRSKLRCSEREAGRCVLRTALLLSTHKRD
jgi:hypothetical protein